jgi:hypothetical protein
MKLIRLITTAFWKLYYKYSPEPSRFTKEEAIEIARKHNLEKEVVYAMKQGLSPDEALQDWDLYKFD